MNKIKKQILEELEEVEFLPGEDSKLIGYAERFGGEFILLYEGINFIRYSSPTDCLERIRFYSPNSRLVDGYDSCVIGHAKSDDGIFLIYDKDAMLEQLTQEYLLDTSGIFEDEEDCRISAVEWYEYNILGSYMEGIPAFSPLYSK